VGDNAILGGGTGFHQFIRVGEGAIVDEGIMLTLDLPPFLVGVGRNEIGGLNLIGLKRRGVSSKAVQELKQAYYAVYLATGSITGLAAAALASGEYTMPEARRFLEFFASSKRGFARVRSGSL
jgi:UDP-N-acetylglucosamine acyltransferase